MDFFIKIRASNGFFSYICGTLFGQTIMKQTFDYLENVAFAATVCDKEGIVLYQNAAARMRDGEVIGQNLYNCHNPKSAEKIRMMMQTGMSNTYEVTNHGKHYFVHHTPWFEEPGGELSGLIELDIEVPGK